MKTAPDYKKKAVLNCFMEHINTWNRVNHIKEDLRPYFYDENGHYAEHGEELSEYLDKLNELAQIIESQPRDYSLLKYVKWSKGESKWK